MWRVSLLVAKGEVRTGRGRIIKFTSCNVLSIQYWDECSLWRPSHDFSFLWPFQVIWPFSLQSASSSHGAVVTRVVTRIAGDPWGASSVSPLLSVPLGSRPKLRGAVGVSLGRFPESPFAGEARPVTTSQSEWRAVRSYISFSLRFHLVFISAFQHWKCLLTFLQAHSFFPWLYLVYL